MLADHRQGEQRRTRVSAPSMFAGIVVDADGLPLIATHASKGSARYRYYVTRALHLKQTDSGIRVPARELEKLVATRIAAIFDDPIELIATAWLDVPVERITTLHGRCSEIAASLRSLRPEAITPLVQQVRITNHGVEIRCHAAAIAQVLDVALNDDAPLLLTLTSDARLARTGMALRLVRTDDGIVTATPDHALIRQVIAARKWWGELRQGEIDITRLASARRSPPHG
jgi:hypothetical protein